MSVRPVDFQISIPRTSEYSRIYNDEQNRGQNAQHQQLLSTQNKIEENLKQVYSKETVDKAKLKEKDKRGNGENRRNKKEGKSDKSTGESIIDIRL